MGTSDPEPRPWLDRYRNVLSLGLILAIVSGGLLFALRRPPPTTITIVPPPPTATPAPTVTPQPTATPGPITVYVTGAVARPESMIQLPFGSRVSEAIDGAGGAIESADLTRVNLAQILRDGDQVHVYLQSEEQRVARGEVLATPNNSGIVYVNVASAEELEQLPRIGPSLAQEIVAYRDAHGPFATLDDLSEVSGIGPSILEEIAPFISFEVR